jgi:hypothetical protein
MSIYANREKILRIIDRDVWKHSWHLPRNEQHCIDWFSPVTEKILKEILLNDLDYITRLSDEIKSILKDIA